MICRMCGERFAQERTKDGYDAYPYGERYERICTHGVCPVCGADDFEREAVCLQCGEEVNEADVSDGFCRFCTEELEQTLDWICSMLTPAQRRWIHEHPDWTLRGESGC